MRRVSIFPRSWLYHKFLGIKELGDLAAAMGACEKGLSTLDTLTSELTPIQLEMKKEMENKLDGIKKQIVFQKNTLVLSDEANTGNSPWERAEAMIPDLAEALRNGDEQGALSCVSFHLPKLILRRHS